MMHQEITRTSSSGSARILARAGAAPTPPEPLHGPTQPLQLRVDELVIALALVDAENNVLRRQLAVMGRSRDTYRAEVMAG